MACNRIYRAVRAADTLLPDPLGMWVQEWWLEPHAERCPECRTHLRRMGRLNGVIRLGLLGDAAFYPAPGVPFGRRFARDASSGWPRLMLATAGLAAAVALTAQPRWLPASSPALVLPAVRNASKMQARVPLGEQGPPSALLLPEIRPDKRQPTGPFSRPLLASAKIGALPGFLALPDLDGTPAGNRPWLPALPERMADAEYLNGENDPALLAFWATGNARDRQLLQALAQPTPAHEDDFIRPALPMVASADPSAGNGDAARDADREAKSVDARLFRKVTLNLKAASLDDVCAALGKQCEVYMRTARGVRDEKATVLVKDQPARDVMREIARLFGYIWARSGEEGNYHYELMQTLRSQLAEQEMRNKDIDEALIALDDKLGVFRQYMDQPISRLDARYEQAPQDEKNRLFRFVRGGGFGPVAMYYRLSPQERDQLLSGQELRFRGDQIPAELRMPALEASGLKLAKTGGYFSEIGEGGETPAAQCPGAEPEIMLKLDRSEAGDVALWVGTNVYWKKPDGSDVVGGSLWPVQTGRSPSAEPPDNAKANAALKDDPAFTKRVDFDPRPSCRRNEHEPLGNLRQDGGPFELTFTMEYKEPHVSTADVWEEVHEKTGMSVVADSYLHAFPLAKIAKKNVTVFDAVCGAGDEMGVRWQKDGAFLLGRSTRYYWDKLKEVPNRLLVHWREDRDRTGYLPLQDFLEMSLMNDQQLGSANVGSVVSHCWGLDEWGIIANGTPVAGEYIPEEMRKRVRAIAHLDLLLIQKAQTPEGLVIGTLPPPQRDELVREFQLASGKPDETGRLRFRIDYFPRGSYIWKPLINRATFEQEGKNWVTVGGRTKEEALAAAQRIYPKATADQIKRIRGKLVYTVIRPDGSHWGNGGPDVLAE